jgi:hypothetical protein
LRNALLIVASTAWAAAAYAQEEPNHPVAMKTGQVTIVAPPDTWLAIDVVEFRTKRFHEGGFPESQINLYRNGAKVYECNFYNPKQSRQYLIKTGHSPETYMLRGWTKSRPPDREPPYHPWYAMPFREERDEKRGKMELTFENDLKCNKFKNVTTVKVRLFHGALTQAEFGRLRSK